MQHDFFSTESGRIPDESNGQLVLKGLHQKDGNFSTGELTYDIQGGITGLGDPITADAAAEMLHKWQTAIPDAQETYVDFGKETLLFLLSQAGCEGIRFYFCKNHNDAFSLILIGLDKESREINCNDIGNYSKKQPLIVEMGGGGIKDAIILDIESAEPKCPLYKYFDSKKEKL
jgi:hypothetical protein